MVHEPSVDLVAKPLVPDDGSPAGGAVVQPVPSEKKIALTAKKDKTAAADSLCGLSLLDPAASAHSCSLLSLSSPPPKSRGRGRRFKKVRFFGDMLTAVTQIGSVGNFLDEPAMIAKDILAVPPQVFPAGA